MVNESPEPTAPPALVLRRPRRTEVQALRALAVSLVCVYHFWPSRLAGGYIGVDVFFVISGYLITSHIIGSAIPNDRTFSIPGFYVRRVRRLLPAALTTIAVTLAAVLIFVPDSLWIDFGHQALSTTLYFENWRLAADAVNYSAPAVNTSPFQHFWSLSVEEQFYLAWPLLIVVFASVGGKSDVRRKRSVALLLLGVTALSFAYCVYDTRRDPAAAYFVTPTRIWEFGLGGLLAMTPLGRLGRLTRSILSLIGFAVILVSARKLSDVSAFPGWLALAPTLGATAVIAGGSPRGPSLTPIFELGPVQWLGDISYSVYLWHWPLLLLAPFVLDKPVGTSDKLVLLVATLAVAWGSKTFVEDRFRADRRPREGSKPNSTIRRLAVPVIAAATGMAVLSLAAVALSSTATKRSRAAFAHLAAVEHHPPKCFGGAALALRDCKQHHVKGVVPSPIIAFSDTFTATPAGSGCQIRGFAERPVACTFGAKHASVRVALVGDSHAGQWEPALERLAVEHGWALTTYLKSGCAFTSVLWKAGLAYGQSCPDWNRQVLQDLLRQRFDVVFVSGSAEDLGSTPYSEPEPSNFMSVATGLADRWKMLERFGSTVIPIRDEPNPRVAGDSDAPTCVATHAADVQECDLPESRALLHDPQIPATKASGTYLINLTRFFCTNGVCPVVIGGVLVYQNVTHVTATYARTLAPYIDHALERAPTCLTSSSGSCLPSRVRFKLGL